MPYTAPTAADLKAVLVEFDSVSDALVDRALSVADDFVDDSWISEASYQMGYMLKAAEMLTGWGLGSALGVGDAKSFKSGDFSQTNITGADLTSGPIARDYGMEFRTLAKRNRTAGARVANGT